MTSSNHLQSVPNDRVLVPEVGYVPMFPARTGEYGAIFKLLKRAIAALSK